MKRLGVLTILAVLTLNLTLGLIYIGSIKNKPYDPYYYFDKGRIHKDSEYTVNAYFKENGQVDTYVIKFYYNGSMKIIECYDFGGYTADEWLDSYLIDFRGIK